MITLPKQFCIRPNNPELWERERIVGYFWGDFLEETIQPAILKNPKSMPEEQYQKQASLKTTKLGLLILLHITMTLQNITFYKN